MTCDRCGVDFSVMVEVTKDKNECIRALREDLELERNLVENLREVEGRFLDVARERRSLREEVDDLVDRFSHSHEAMRDPDGLLLGSCGSCGLDIRHAVHGTEGER